MARTHSLPSREQYQMVDVEDGQAREFTPDFSDSEDNVAEPSTIHSRYRKQVWFETILPPSLSARLESMLDWLRGPNPPRPYHVNPLFESVQTGPIKWFHRLVKRESHRFYVGILASCVYITTFIIILSNSTLPEDIGGYGQPVKLDCTETLWPSPVGCGPDGLNCLPFEDHSFAFSCPANCQDVKVLNVRTIGIEEINYRPLVIGGFAESESGNKPIYRGDSFICGSALHAGIVSGDRGGCGIVTRVGEGSNYQGVDRNGISSIGFNSTFPLSFTFLDGKDAISECSDDPRWKSLILTVIFTSLFSIFTTTPLSFYCPVFVAVYFQIALASDPPPFSDYYAGLSIAAARFLPAAFVGVFIYSYCVRHTLRDLTAQLEKTVLWLGGCWFGALSNYTLDHIPIQRLTSHDLKQQPGAIPALITIVLILLVIALSQAWAFRIEGRLLRYLAIYGILAASLLLLVAIPKLNLRIHHYILALLLLPGTSLQTRPSLLYQGFLVGLFLNGISRWDFDSILQTSTDLLQDGKLESALPEILTPVINSTTMTLSWATLPKEYDGVSVLVNDVERFRGFEEDNQTEFTWTRHTTEYPEYFRFGFVKYLPLRGMSFADYTKAGVWQTDGSWQHMLPGPS